MSANAARLDCVTITNSSNHPMRFIQKSVGLGENYVFAPMVLEPGDSVIWFPHKGISFECEFASND
jgi:hypothetical protein